MPRSARSSSGRCSRASITWMPTRSSSRGSSRALIMAVGLGIALSVRPDPKEIGEALGYGAEGETATSTAAPLREILRRPGVITALVAAVASFAVMVSVMNLSGYIVVGHGHSHGRHVLGDQRAHRRHVRARARRRKRHRPRRSAGRARRRPRRDGSLDHRHDLDHERVRDEHRALRAGPRLGVLVRRRDDGARRLRGAVRAREARRASPTCSRASPARRSRSRAAPPTTTSESRRSPSARRSPSRCRPS